MFEFLFGVSATCIFLFLHEHVKGRMSIKNKWEDLTIDQWFLIIGSMTLPFSLIGMLLTPQ
jgi:hypothetical protein